MSCPSLLQSISTVKIQQQYSDILDLHVGNPLSNFFQTREIPDFPGQWEPCRQTDRQTETDRQTDRQTVRVRVRRTSIAWRCRHHVVVQ